ncbi:RagB/SusD family nutrient uptake outer membrane protein [Prolixibacteraceae bacterium JC049]|nr:RagB/SusD family nutrient uptake outer membrane protein [Prolixibacteraceae bacterium JC049]
MLSIYSSTLLMMYIQRFQVLNLRCLLRLCVVLTYHSNSEKFKQMKKILIAIVCLITIASCKDFLKEESKSQMTVNYYETERGLYEGVAAVYSSCRELFKEPLFRIQVYSDIWDVGASRNNSEDISENIGNGDVNKVWVELNQAIMITNRMLQYTGIEPTAEERTKQIYAAELRTLCAYFHWVNVEMWGKHAHYQDRIFDQYDVAMLEINQQSVEFFYHKIMEDINFGIEALPTAAETKEFGRITKGAAKAMKARFLMSLAGYAHADYSGTDEHNVFTKLGYNSVEDCYREAKQLADELINGSDYMLADEFGDVFWFENQNNKEVIWSVQWTTDNVFNGDAQGFHRYATGRTCNTIKQDKANDGSVLYYEVSAQRNEADHGERYTMPCHSRWYGREYRHMIATYKWITAFDNKDKRRESTFESVYYRVNNGVEEPDYSDTIVYMPFREVSYEEDLAGNKRGVFIDGLNEVYDLEDPTDAVHYGGPRGAGRSKSYSLKKFWDRSRVNKPKQNEGHENGIIFRLAEMYLIKAECEWKLGGGDEAVYAALQPLWDRAFENNADADVYKTPVDLNYILDEYARELGGEWYRWFLLKRTRSLVDRITVWCPKSKEEDADGVKRSRDYVAPHHFLKPVPEKQLIRFSNWTDEMQAPGYK